MTGFKMALNSTTVSSIITLLMTDNLQINEQNKSVSPSYTPNNATQIMTTTSKHINNESIVEFNLAPPSSHEILVSISILFCIIGSVGLLGNSLVVIVVLLDRKMRQSVTNIFIMNLAVADFLIMLFGVPEIVQFMINRGWLLGTAVCKTNRFILVVSLYVSILSLISVCIERFVAIVYPIKAHILCGRRKIILAVLLIWTIAVGCGSPTVLFNTVLSPAPVSEIKFCILLFPRMSHLTIFRYMEFSIFYFVPVIIQVILYSVIGRKLYASTEELHTRFQMRPDSRYRTERASDTIKARKDVVKMLAASVLVYIICYAPNQIVLFYNTFSPSQFHATWSFMVFSYVIGYVNSAANPVLYCIFSQNFRQNFKKYLCCMCLRKSKPYRKVFFDSSESRGLSRKAASTRTTMVRE
ncbi:hypothetical protein CHS0354_036752 [Potamilus streckersoni]|uniref:Thyrotropin-releasing hormone receptor n=1 Tax=Potamilus streckersoni TaxID=2493646 RepID=A0AAE0WAB4_9BIVA|nr:hypothetical protein CHS0354_036752 [Potamilus streckersoni]